MHRVHREYLWNTFADGLPVGTFHRSAEWLLDCSVDYLLNKLSPPCRVDNVFVQGPLYLCILPLQIWCMRGKRLLLRLEDFELEMSLCTYPLSVSAP